MWTTRVGVVYLRTSTPPTVESPPRRTNRLSASRRSSRAMVSGANCCREAFVADRPRDGVLTQLSPYVDPVLSGMPKRRQKETSALTKVLPSTVIVLSVIPSTVVSASIVPPGVTCVRVRDRPSMGSV